MLWQVIPPPFPHIHTNFNTIIMTLIIIIIIMFKKAIIKNLKLRRTKD